MEQPETVPASAVTTALWLFILVQAGTVAAFTAGTRPTAGYPDPPQSSTDVALAVVQMVTAALMGPMLLADRGAVVRVAGSVIPFAILAGRLADRPFPTVAAVLCHCLLWLPALAVLTASRPGRVMIAFLALGLPVLRYVGLEYAGHAPVLAGCLAWVSPTLGVVATGLHGSTLGAFLVPLAAIVAGEIAIFRTKSSSRLGLDRLQ